MYKNVAGQHIIFIAYDTTTGLLKTGDAANLTAYQSIDSASPPTVLADASATEISATLAKGAYVFDLAQGETNGDAILYSCNSTTANIQIDPVLVFTVGDFTATQKTSITTAATAATPNLNAAYDAAKTAATQASVNAIPTNPYTGTPPSAATIAAEVLTEATATPIAANVKKVNSITVNGVGTAGNPWGP